MNTMKITLELNERQADVLVAALDFYSMIRTGNLREILLIFPPGEVVRNQYVRDLIAQLKHGMFPHLEQGCCYGIRDPRVGAAQVAFDIQQVIRHGLAWKRHPEGGILLTFDEPYRCSEEPLPTITIED